MSQAERNVYALTALHKYYVRILISALAKQYMISCKSKAAVFHIIYMILEIMKRVSIKLTKKSHWDLDPHYRIILQRTGGSSIL